MSGRSPPILGAALTRIRRAAVPLALLALTSPLGYLGTSAVLGGEREEARAVVERANTLKSPPDPAAVRTARERLARAETWIAVGAWLPPLLAGSAAAIHAAVTRATGRRSVLLVDDDPVGRAVLAAVLRRHGLVVRLAGTGAEAAAAFERFDFDLAIFDLRLPDIDGIELTRRLRARRTGSTPTILLVSARVSTDDARAARAAGADAVLTKPLPWNAVASRLDRRPRAAPVEGVVPAASTEGFDERRVLEMLELLPAETVRDLATTASRAFRDLDAALDDAGRAGDAERQSAIAHRVAGSAAIWGCVDLENAARALEAAIERGRGDIPGARAAVATRFAGAVARLEALFADRERK